MRGSPGRSPEGPVDIVVWAAVLTIAFSPGLRAIRDRRTWAKCNWRLAAACVAAILGLPAALFTFALRVPATFVGFARGRFATDGPYIMQFDRRVKTTGRTWHVVAAAVTSVALVLALYAIVMAAALWLSATVAFAVLIPIIIGLPGPRATAAMRRHAKTYQGDGVL